MNGMIDSKQGINTSLGSTQAVLDLSIDQQPQLRDVQFGSNELIQTTAAQWVDVATAKQHTAAATFVLCWGGQGVGKTLLARVLANHGHALCLPAARSASA